MVVMAAEVFCEWGVIEFIRCAAHDVNVLAMKLEEVLSDPHVLENYKKQSKQCIMLSSIFKKGFEWWSNFYWQEYVYIK